ncbi:MULTISPECIES: Co2+/Mg2+ efflux protein ApaG [Salinivibrio]|uniref:Protein ApaG n=1 Tax=Salinivibrio siamensis TaxID=414286 RepID=A0ABX3KCK6_9GAMM|nr:MULTISPECIES: Co2+/Mg2+ efflux protein ApaG [Salinivibrio]KKA45080.1 magnesium transporter ApaG [Salinivibrio sp. KP-1]MPS32800.1 Co2+/Mg2+ efflux protein ApaG [Salinivibrio sp. VYel7]MPX90946.1 Co2+/Mg2+ efflux protein ApaG [Salinivibrio sp. VYel1]MPX94189.1 Co2+/Mg2+ efflux protein ApaG [Salinivibrio sp. VYel9]MPX97253.1 Co2+/Mg2+ efflux protein ApaG [Salinivibrio sp. VYel6]
MQATEQSQFEIHVATQYVEDQSEPDNERFVFSYTVTIENRGDAPAQLMRRKWLITDANGKELEIEGEGVVGEQPKIAAGEKYTYTSGTIIETPVGVMQGFYTMQGQDDQSFKVDIAPFRLALPNILH